SEDAEAKTFWDAFFNVFGVTRRRLASFEAPVKQRSDGGRISTGFIDLFWKGVLLVEHKSRGKDLNRAYAQAIDYFPGIPERDLPHYVLVSDFARLRLIALETDEQWEFPLSDLHKHIRLFGFTVSYQRQHIRLSGLIAAYQSQAIRPQDPVNIHAAERMGRLHDQLKSSGYTDHPLEVLLVRLLFCLFADDTGLFQPAQAFREWVEQETQEDGRDLGPKLTELFQILNTQPEARQKSLDERLSAFPYV
ncbi:type IIL restriction-modification enzyme MmeI, partial [Acidithiobacillus ferriphilus]|uniref:type IIL restriction-modification enzyme MmeI n=1 Tax=Acidithiobacillus ferriphilus TaxID=1689834 RepID=UPI002DB63E06